MRKLTLAAALTVAITSSPVHAFGLFSQQAKKADLHFGAGSRLCSEWTSDRATGSWGQKAQWLLGYLSAVNVRGETELVSQATGKLYVDVDMIFKGADLYCKENPTDSFHDYATAFVSSQMVVHDDDLEW